MLERVIKKDKFSIYTSLTRFNYDEENKIYISFHTTKSVDTLLSEKELETLINELKEAKRILQESNKNKKLKGDKNEI